MKISLKGINLLFANEFYTLEGCCRHLNSIVGGNKVNTVVLATILPDGTLTAEVIDAVTYYDDNARESSNHRGVSRNA